MARYSLMMALCIAGTGACADEPPATTAPATPAATLAPAPAVTAAAEATALADTPEPESEPPAATPLDSLERVLRERGEALGSDLRPLRVRTTASVNLRQGPGSDHPIVRALPQDTIAVALHGEIEDYTSGPGGRGRWMYVVVSGEHAGWTSARFLAADEGCIPPEGALPRDEGALVVRATLTEDRPALLSISSSTDPPSTTIEAWALGDDCTPQRLSRTTLAGVIEELRPLDASDRDGGPWTGTGRFIVAWRETSEHIDGADTEWSILLAGRDEPLWHERFATDASIPRGRRERIRVRSEDASGRCPFSIFFPDAGTNKYGAGGEYCFLYHFNGSFGLSW